MTVTVFTRTTCAPCHMLKSYLQRKGVQYQEKNVDDNPEEAAEIFAKTGFTMVPVTVIDDKIVSGFNLPLISELLMV